MSKPRNLQEALAKLSPIEQALGIAVAYGGREDWHKAWVIDQMVRVLCGSPERYAELVKDACSGEDGPATFEWDCGIPP
jgi:hypothetical protein